MKRLISWILGIPIFVVLAAFALANRKWIVVSLDPLTPDQPLVAVNMPVWALLFIGIFLGLVAGGMAAWVGQARWRRTARKALAELDIERMNRRRIENRLKEAENPALPAPTRKAS